MCAYECFKIFMFIVTELMAVTSLPSDSVGAHIPLDHPSDFKSTNQFH